MQIEPKNKMSGAKMSPRGIERPFIPTGDVTKAVAFIEAVR
jgi:hypothetical protein